MIRINKPEQSPLPLVPEFDKPVVDLVKVFEDTLNRIGGSFKQLANPDMLKSFIEETYPAKRMTISNVPAYEGTHKLSSCIQALDLEKLDLAVLQGGIAVAENASIWLRSCFKLQKTKMQDREERKGGAKTARGLAFVFCILCVLRVIFPCDPCG